LVLLKLTHETYLDFFVISNILGKKRLILAKKKISMQVYQYRHWILNWNSPGFKFLKTGVISAIPYLSFQCFGIFCKKFLKQLGGGIYTIFSDYNLTTQKTCNGTINQSFSPRREYFWVGHQNCNSQHPIKFCSEKLLRFSTLKRHLHGVVFYIKTTLTRGWNLKTFFGKNGKLLWYQALEEGNKQKCEEKLTKAMMFVRHIYNKFFNILN